MPAAHSTPKSRFGNNLATGLPLTRSVPSPGPRRGIGCPPDNPDHRECDPRGNRVDPSILRSHCCRVRAITIIDSVLIKIIDGNSSHEGSTGGLLSLPPGATISRWLLRRRVQRVRPMFKLLRMVGTGPTPPRSASNDHGLAHPLPTKPRIAASSWGRSPIAASSEFVAVVRLRAR
jgi:hypothetical protein